MIDGYVDIETLNLLSKKNAVVDVKIYTYNNAKLTNADIANFNSQYLTLSAKKMQFFHDKFLVIDGKAVYHIRDLIKDAEKKCFGISLW